MIRVAILRERRRLRQGKRTVFLYNAREIDERKIERFIRGHFGVAQLDNMRLDDGECSS